MVGASVGAPVGASVGESEGIEDGTSDCAVGEPFCWTKPPSGLADGAALGTDDGPTLGETGQTFIAIDKYCRVMVARGKIE